jgi:hypothetical protein
MPSRATKDDSIRKASRTYPRWKPRALSIPIYCLLSNTERATITPRAAMPTSKPSPHEAHEQVVEEPLRRRTVFDLFLYGDGLEAVLGELFLQVLRSHPSVHPILQSALVALRRHRGSREVVHGSPRGGHAGSEERRVLENPDHIQVPRLA